MMAVAAPRVFATAWDALHVTWQHAHVAIDRRQAVSALVSIIQLAVLTLPPVGMALTFLRAGRRVSGGVWRGTETRPGTRAVVIAASSAAVTALFLSWWTNGAYRPIRAGERGTLSSRDFDVRAAVGRPARHGSNSAPRPRYPSQRPSGSDRSPAPAVVPTPRQDQTGTAGTTHPRTKQSPTGAVHGTTTSQDPWTSDPFTTTTDQSTPPPPTTTTTTTTDTTPTTTTTTTTTSATDGTTTAP
jgi:hypothetical protein